MPLAVWLDNRASGWGEFAEQLLRFQRKVQSEAAFAYISTAPSLRRETEALCRHLGIEDYTHVLEPDEEPPNRSRDCSDVR